MWRTALLSLALLAPTSVWALSCLLPRQTQFFDEVSVTVDGDEVDEDVVIELNASGSREFLDLVFTDADGTTHFVSLELQE